MYSNLTNCTIEACGWNECTMEILLVKPTGGMGASLSLYKAKQKNMCVSGYMLFKIRVGRSDYFFYFLQ